MLVNLVTWLTVELTVSKLEEEEEADIVNKNTIRREREIVR